MARLIDADKINYHEHTECMGHGDVETVRTVTDKEIAEIPTVETVEAVRCRDCKFGVTPYGDEHDGWTECSNIHSRPLFGCNDFCSLGERRTDG